MAITIAGRVARIAMVAAFVACAPRPGALPGFMPTGAFGERVQTLALDPGVTATIVAPPRFDPAKHVDLILYALPNGNSTAETMGRRMGDGIGWRHDIQHIAAQTRALRERGMSQAVVVYLETDTKSWPEWRRRLGYPRANARIVSIVDQLRGAIGAPAQLAVSLAAHSGGGSFIIGYIDGQRQMPAWLRRIAFLDANYSVDSTHVDRLVRWLGDDAERRLIVLAYDDREIVLDGKKVVSDSGGTWRATQRMLPQLGRSLRMTTDTLGAFLRAAGPQVEILLHPNPANHILHTEMIGEMNGYMHAMLARRPGHEQATPVLSSTRAYSRYVDDGTSLPQAAAHTIPARSSRAPGGSAFMASIATLVRESREDAIRRELLAGNVPSFLRELRTVEVTDTTADGTRHTVAYDVLPDYLAIGSDDDFVRIPMTPYTAQAFCDAFGFVLPTRKMTDDIWKAATVRLEPRPLTQEREASPTFLQHHRIIEEQLRAAPGGVRRGVFVAGIKKDVVITPRLRERADRVAIYGWHYPAGNPIQPLYTGHVDWYVDYSHGIRPVRRTVRVDGVARAFEAVVGDPALAGLLSDEGPIPVPRYGR